MQYLTISASAYSASSTEDVLQGLRQDGLSLIKLPELVDTVSPSEIDATVRYGLGGRAIFQRNLKDDEGNYIPELDEEGRPTGFFASDYGRHQRIQRLIPHGKQGSNILVHFRSECVCDPLAWSTQPLDGRLCVISIGRASIWVLVPGYLACMGLLNKFQICDECVLMKLCPAYFAHCYIRYCRVQDQGGHGCYALPKSQLARPCSFG